MTDETTGTRGPESQAPDATGGGQQPEQEPRTFTQEQLNAIIADRLARERAQYADYDDLRQAKTELDEMRQAQMSELEKAQERAQQLEAERDRALDRAQEILIRSAFIAEAAKLGAAHPEDAYALSDRDGVEVGEDGTVDGVSEAVQGLIEAGRLVMSGKPQAPSLDGNAGSGQRSGDKSGAMVLSPDEMRMAQKLRLTPEQYAQGKKKTGGQ